MRAYIAVAALVASVNAYAYPAYNTTSSVPEPVYTTKVVTELTTVCPEPTEITYGTKTYTVTEATTLTISDCPCTVTEPVEPTSYPTKPVEPPVYTPPAPPATTEAPYPSKNVTVPTAPAPTGTGAPSTTAPAPPAFTGAATQAGVGLLAIAGALVAFL